MKDDKKKPGGISLIIGMGKPSKGDKGPSEDAPGPVAAQEFLDAVEAGDADGVWAAFQEMFMAADEGDEPEEDAEEPTDEDDI